MYRLDLKNHVALTSHSELVDICMPLVENLGISMFCYHRIFNDGSEIMLSNNIAWAEHFYKMHYLMGGEAVKALGQNEFKYTLWPLENLLKMQCEVSNICDVNYGITLRLISEDYYELFGFGLKAKGAQGLNIFFSNMDLLEQFCCHFKENTVRLIEKCNQNKIILVEKTQEVYELNAQIRANKFDYRQEFLRSMPLSLAKNETITLLSERETECAKFLLLGYTMREIADQLHISPRTVESHFDNIKNKLGCIKKSELIAKLMKSKLVKSILNDISMG